MTKKLTKAQLDRCIEQSNVHMAMGDEQRQKIMYVLSSNIEMNVNTLSEQFELTRSAVTHHIKIMYNAKLLLRRKTGKEVYYKLNSETVNNTISYLQSMITTPLANDV